MYCIERKITGSINNITSFAVKNNYPLNLKSISTRLNKGQPIELDKKILSKINSMEDALILTGTKFDDDKLVFPKEKTHAEIVADIWKKRTAN